MWVIGVLQQIQRETGKQAWCLSLLAVQSSSLLENMGSNTGLNGPGQASGELAIAQTRGVCS